MEKRVDQFAPVEKIVLVGNNKHHMASSLKKAITKRPRLKNKANNSGKLAVKKAHKIQRNIVVKLNKEAKKSFLKRFFY